MKGKYIFSGKVSKTLYDETGCLICMAGDTITGNLAYYEDVPFILSDIYDMTWEYVAFESWIEVDRNSIQMRFNCES